MSRFKVLHITKWFPNPEDPQLGIFVAKHIQAVQTACDVHVLHLCPQHIEKIEVREVEVEGLPTTRISYPAEKSIFYKLCFLNSAIGRAIDDIKKSFGQPDLIHAHLLAQPALIGRKHFPKTPMVISEHWTGFVNGYFEKLPVFKRSVFRKCANDAEAVTVPSIGLQQALKNHGFDANIRVVANVIETIDSVADTLPTDQLEILTVADMHDHNKNISGSLEVLSKVDWPFRFRIIGDGEDLETLKIRASDLKLNDRVFFEGRKENPEVLKALKECHILLVYSRHETFSMVTAEALAAGTPVIATRCGGPETFVNEGAGIIIEPDDPKALQEALNQMNNSWQSYDRDAIREEYSSRFSRESVGEEFLKIYQMALAE